MEIYLVERIVGSGDTYVRYVDRSHETLEGARSYAEEMNEKCKKNFDEYNSCEFMASTIVNELFLSYIKENDKELYDIYNDVMKSAEMCTYKAFDTEKFNKKRDEFFRDDDAFENELRKSDLSEYRKGNLLKYKELYDLYHDGLPYYHVNPTPIEVFK